MNHKDYRLEYAEGLKAQNPSTVEDTDADADPNNLITELLDQANDERERIEIFGKLGGLSFEVRKFAPYVADYDEALRTVVRTEPGSVLADMSLESLALRNDAFAQEYLVNALEADGEIAPERALQLLSSDDHAQYLRYARKVYEEATTTVAKSEALRALAADPNSTGLLKSILQDQSADPELRIIGGAALQHVDPQAYGDIATQIVSSDDENDDVIAATISTLSNIGQNLKQSQREELSEIVDRLAGTTSSPAIRATSERLLNEFSR